MLFEEINPFVRQVVNARLTIGDKRDVFNEIKTVDGRLFYVRAGNGKMRFGSRVYDLNAGTIVLFGADTSYVWEIESIRYYAINFDYTQSFSHVKKTFHPVSATKFTQSDVIEKVRFDDEPLLNEPLVLPCSPEFEKDFKRISTEYLMNAAYSSISTSALLKSLLVEILRKKKSRADLSGKGSKTLVQSLIEYVGNNYSKQISYDDLAKEFHFNPSYLNRVFKAYTGKTLHKFILDYRINTAMETLSTQSLPINQVAELCGFSNPYHFTKAFRKFTGVSPSEYKRRYDRGEIVTDSPNRDRENSP